LRGGLQRLPLVAVELVRHLDLEPVEDVAPPAAAGSRGALPAEALDGSMLGSGRNPDPLRAGERRHLDGRPLDRLGDRDRDRHLEIAVGALAEDRGGGDPGDDVEVAGRPAERSVLALAGDPDPGPVADAGRDLDPVALELSGQPGSTAGLARGLDHLAAPAAARARLA